MNIPTQFTPDGYECVYLPKENVCEVTVKGYTLDDGTIIERGGASNPNDKRIISFKIPEHEKMRVPLYPCNPKVRETFEDSLLDKRDLLGNFEFRNQPETGMERRMFASAFDAAQKVRAKMTILSVNKLAVVLNPSLFTVIDCLAKDSDGAFWLIACTDNELYVKHEGWELPLSAYVLETGKYLPGNIPVRLGVWYLAPNAAPKFYEVKNDRAAARDLVIKHLQSTPF
jgi:hypothetical protein